VATHPVKRYVAERFARYDAALQPQLDFGAAPAQIVSPLDNNIAQATYLGDATKLDLNAVVASCMCDGSIGSLTCERCTSAKRRRLRELLRSNGMRRKCGSADELDFNRNGT
jgi:hypothetical protein